MSESGDRMETTQDVGTRARDRGAQESEVDRVSVRDARPELGAVTQKGVVFDVGRRLRLLRGLPCDPTSPSRSTATRSPR